MTFIMGGNSWAPISELLLLGYTIDVVTFILYLVVKLLRYRQKIDHIL